MKRPPATPPRKLPPPVPLYDDGPPGASMRAARTVGALIGTILFLVFLGEVVVGRSCGVG